MSKTPRLRCQSHQLLSTKKGTVAGLQDDDVALKCAWFPALPIGWFVGFHDFLIIGYNTLTAQTTKKPAVLIRGSCFCSKAILCW